VSEDSQRMERNEPLQTVFRHLLLSRNTVAADGFDAFSVENGILIIRVLVLEADISFLGHENTG